ncbi:MAG: class I SAM-dependent methyltransferase [Deltaproteobacteria bacterium]|nr:class I SAM-dependent methyltransferase [Deltaproteobacteria bacterium]
MAAPTPYDLAAASIGTRIRMARHAAWLAGRRFGSALECGCGRGTYTPAILAAADRVAAVDLSPALVAQVRERLPAADCRVADLCALPFADASFDLVVAADVIEHVPDPAAALAEVARVARPGAVVLVSVPSDRWLRVCRVLHQDPMAYGHHVLFAGPDFAGMCEAAGLSVELHDRVQSGLSALLEGLIVEASAAAWGRRTVTGSCMAERASGSSSILARAYLHGSRLAFPAFAAIERVLPRDWGYEHFFVLRKGGAGGA